MPRTRYDVDRRGRDGATPLCEACWSGHVDVARLLLEHGADVHGGDYRYTPLLLACRNGRADAAALLFDRGADNRASPEGLTPLYRACQYGHTKAALLCLDRGADVDQTAFGMTPFYIACAKGHRRCGAALPRARGFPLVPGEDKPGYQQNPVPGRPLPPLRGHGGLVGAC